MNQKNKLTSEERSLEVIQRFNDLGIEYPNNILCAIELVREVIFISSKGYDAGWRNRQKYWGNILQILEDKLL